MGSIAADAASKEKDQSKGQDDVTEDWNGNGMHCRACSGYTDDI